MIYTPRLLTGNYRDRQREANELGAVCYYEQHFNAIGGEAAFRADYACCVVAKNSSHASREWGRFLASSWATLLETRVGGDRGLMIGGRGDGNLRHTKMPAVLGEPCFASHPEQAEWIRDDTVQVALARVVVQGIHKFFPTGGVVALSVGHKGKVPDVDRGAELHGGGFEADYAERVIFRVAELLAGGDNAGGLVITTRGGERIRSGEYYWVKPRDGETQIMRAQDGPAPFRPLFAVEAVDGPLQEPDWGRVA